MTGGTQPDCAWAEKVPLGAPWIPIPVDKSSAPSSKKKRKRKSKNSGKQQPKALIPPARFYGDHVISDSPHQKPEVKLLLRHYNDIELSSRRPGRTFGEDREPDDFTAGLQKLRAGSLAEWAHKTTRDRGLHVEAAEDPQTTEDDSDSDESDEDDTEEPEMTLDLIHAFDGLICNEKHRRWIQKPASPQAATARVVEGPCAPTPCQRQTSANSETSAFLRLHRPGHGIGDPISPLTERNLQCDYCTHPLQRRASCSPPAGCGAPRRAHADGILTARVCSAHNAPPALAADSSLLGGVRCGDEQHGDGEHGKQSSSARTEYVISEGHRFDSSSRQNEACQFNIYYV
ncbi:hypothetical protein B0H14DRAFT_2580552 [Mycena olivaceomarginata]|nr:hypothetical protein B0H14DRAFT_2580552 [Mycena olivaceomarginata]